MIFSGAKACNTGCMVSMKICKMDMFIIAIVVACVAFVFSSCKEETSRQMESSSSNVTKESVKFRRINAKIDSNSNWYRRGKPIPGLCISVGETCFQSPDDPHTRIKYKGSIKLPSISDIDFKYEKKASRSASDIVKIIRQRKSGLHFTYYKHLRKNPGIKGKITLKFTIAPKGEISDISIVSSTTQNRNFDAEILEKVSHWRFNSTKYGKTTVTMPLIFSE
jgi:TonB family protein